MDHGRRFHAAMPEYYWYDLGMTDFLAQLLSRKIAARSFRRPFRQRDVAFHPWDEQAT